MIIRKKVNKLEAILDFEDNLLYIDGKLLSKDRIQSLIDTLSKTQDTYKRLSITDEDIETFNKVI